MTPYHSGLCIHVREGIPGKVVVCQNSNTVESLKQGEEESITLREGRKVNAKKNKNPKTIERGKNMYLRHRAEGPRQDVAPAARMKAEQKMKRDATKKIL